MFPPSHFKKPFILFCTRRIARTSLTRLLQTLRVAVLLLATTRAAPSDPTCHSEAAIRSRHPRVLTRPLVHPTPNAPTGTTFTPDRARVQWTARKSTRLHS